MTPPPTPPPQPAAPERRRSILAPLLAPLLPLSSAADPAQPTLLSRTSQLFLRRPTVAVPAAPPLQGVVHPPAHYVRHPHPHAALSAAHSALRSRRTILSLRPLAPAHSAAAAAAAAPARPSAARALRSWYELICQPALAVVPRRAAPLVFAAPAFHLTAFGRRAAHDVVALYCNALRAESRTLFLLLCCLHERAPLLRRGDLVSFFIWLRPYAHFVRAALAAAHSGLVARLALPPAQRALFDRRAAAVQRPLHKLLSHQQAVLNAHPQKAALRLLALFNTYATHLLAYLHSLETSLPVLIRAAHPSAAQLDRLSALVFAHFRAEPHFRTNLVRLLRWLAARPNTAANWRRRHLDHPTALRNTQWKKSGPAEEVVHYFAHNSHVFPYASLYHDPHLPTF